MGQFTSGGSGSGIALAVLQPPHGEGSVASVLNTDTTQFPVSSMAWWLTVCCGPSPIHPPWP